MSIITLTTDYGLKDHFVGALKGKILSQHEKATIIDISHDIDPFNTAQASYIVAAAWSSFPKGTVHLIGVDAERNRETRHVAFEWNEHYFVCADNGIPGMLMYRTDPQQIVAINIHDRLHSQATDLDVFVTVACHLSKGGKLNVIGREISEVKQIMELQPVVSSSKSTIKGNVSYIDHFGNVATNISRQLFMEVSKGRPYEIVLNPLDKNHIKSILARYSDVAANEQYNIKSYEGTRLALFNEAGFLEIAIFRSNPSHGTASSLLGLSYRDPIVINFLSSPTK